MPENEKRNKFSSFLPKRTKEKQPQKYWFPMRKCFYGYSQNTTSYYPNSKFVVVQTPCDSVFCQKCQESLSEALLAAYCQLLPQADFAIFVVLDDNNYNNDNNEKRERDKNCGRQKDLCCFWTRPQSRFTSHVIRRREKKQICRRKGSLGNDKSKMHWACK